MLSKIIMLTIWLLKRISSRSRFDIMLLIRRLFDPTQYNEKIPISHEFINEFLYKENQLQLHVFLVHIQHPTNVHRCHESGNRVQFIALFLWFLKCFSSTDEDVSPWFGLLWSDSICIQYKVVLSAHAQVSPTESLHGLECSVGLHFLAAFLHGNPLEN